MVHGSYLIRRALLCFSLLFLLNAAVSPCAQAAEKNIILFVTDDQGQDAGCYGNKVIKTPNLDALAADGARFDFAYCTTASCSASRSVILTGLHNHANGHYGHQHSYHKFSSYPNVQSLPVLLEKAGYRTGRIGKYHVAPEEVYRFQTVLRGNSRNAVQMANASKDFISEKSEKPFFLYFCTSDPHRGGGIVKDNPYKPDRFGNRDQGYPGVEKVTYTPEEVIVPAFLPDTPYARAELTQYYQSVSRIDQGLGQLINNLKEAGEWDKTLIIYISDHGMAFPGAKTTLYEPGMRSPCIVRNPYEKNRGIANSAMLSWVDLTPTLLDFAGGYDAKANSPKENILPAKQKRLRFHGRSFLPIIGKENPEGWDKVYASHTFHEITMYYPMRVVHGRRYKLIWNIAHQLPYPFASDLWAAPTWQAQYKKGMSAMYGKRTVRAYIHRPEFELFDLKEDPHEANNLADSKEHAQILEKMKAELKTFQKQTNDPWIMKWNYE